MDHTLRPPGRQSVDISVWHPENLDVDALLERYGQRVGEGVLWLGHCIYTQLTDNARCRDTGQVPLMAKYLHKIIGRHHVEAVRQAALWPAMSSVTAVYRAGVRSQAYRILSPYDRARLVCRQITDPGLRHNIRKWCAERTGLMWQRIQRHETLVDAAVCSHLWRNLQRIQIDAKIDFGESFHPSYQIAVEHIQEREFWFTVDDYGRVHTNVTNLPKALRHFLAVDGKRLVDVDVSESQPLFLGVAIARFNSRQTETVQRGARGTEGGQEGRQQQAESSRGAPSLMFDDNMIDKNPQLVGELDRRRLPADVRRYLELCEARGLYQAVADRLGKTREEAKRSVMVAFYDRPSHCNAVSMVLAELFPSVMEAMRCIKRGDYRRLAHFAQRIESAFMFGRVVPRIIELRRTCLSRRSMIRS